mmetsp:Transcript_39450/g.97681  ORF Transcript_39450/g.97681 Transcript_39450/m.97681 type:complete len:304 (-) Transcript_39450:428-1339(-)|eukprot:CAMPEP_0197585992 /NCGR_PEP_ID=MMETSP1326-20131121/8120_1 /TAXON_ID=1155430 /ORGANISM="Genus nov. species nov., Strain RCC2288" /LENGTH=303 /DNA_ID=CAMNT_0043150573 /DNA_START=192 /DNA_END=1103 /DNA_ORIENTATION=+
MYDCCVHLLDIFQETEGVPKLLAALDAAGVQKAVVTGTPVTKKWDQYEKGRPKGTFQDTGRIYFFTATDEMLGDELQSADAAQVAAKLIPFCCGFNPTDLFAPKHCKRILDKHPIFKGVGELFMRYSEISMLTNEEVTRANHPAMKDIYKLCEERNLPMMMHNNAGNESVKPYAGGFEYMHEICKVLDEFRELKLILNGCGMFERGTWSNYSNEIHSLLVKYPNLVMCITTFNLVGCTNALSHEALASLIEEFPTRFTVSTDAAGYFKNYGDSVKVLKDFCTKYLKNETAQKVLVHNAAAIFG